MGPVAAILPGNRLHLQHGPIDLVIGAEGEATDLKTALRAARDRFRTVLPELVEELPALRRPLDPDNPPQGPVARRMAAAVAPHNAVFVTPMAAVAGSVADEILGVMQAAAPACQKIWVNNGGDIALHLSGSASFRAAMIADPRDGSESGQMVLRAADRVGGIATSGRHGRSLSLGIADAVTVLAATAAQADVAATLIANAVDLPDHAAVSRVPAREVDPDSDLGDRLVTVDVGSLSDAEVTRALASGNAMAEAMQDAGLMLEAVITLHGQTITTRTHCHAPDPIPDPCLSQPDSTIDAHAWAQGRNAPARRFAQ